MRRIPISVFCAVLIAASAAGCSGSNTSIGSNPAAPTSAQPLTQTQINQVSASVAPALSLAFSKMDAALSNTTSAMRRRRAIIRSESTSNPFSGSAACDGGGSITVTGSILDGTDAAGSGPVTMSMTVGLSNCRENNVLLQGNPNLAYSGTFHFTNSEIVNPATLTLNSGFLFTLDGVTGSAAYNCTDNIDVSTNAASETGSITLEYPKGQNATAVACSTF